MNLTAGARPTDAPDPSRPTLVFVHGSNPAPWAFRLTMGEPFAAAVARREGARCNVLAWDWNGATVAGVRPRASHEAAVRQGRRLAAELLGRGLAAWRVHLVGHSLGGVVTASAARAVFETTGTRVAKLTLLDPAAFYHDIVFDRLDPAAAAVGVEHYWAPGPTGFSREVRRAGVRDVCVPASFTKFAHWHVVRWYLGTIEDPTSPHGYNASPGP